MYPFSGLEPYFMMNIKMIMRRMRKRMKTNILIYDHECTKASNHEDTEVSANVKEHVS